MLAAHAADFDDDVLDHTGQLLPCVIRKPETKA
jgi:hypothetical protein